MQFLKIITIYAVILARNTETKIELQICKLENKVSENRCGGVDMNRMAANRLLVHVNQ